MLWKKNYDKSRKEHTKKIKRKKIIYKRNMDWQQKKNAIGKTGIFFFGICCKIYSASYSSSLHTHCVFPRVCEAFFCVYKSICFQNTPIFHKLIFSFSSKSFLIVFPNRITIFVVVIAVTVCLYSESVCAFYTGVAVCVFVLGFALLFGKFFSSFGLVSWKFFFFGDGNFFKQF